MSYFGDGAFASTVNSTTTPTTSFTGTAEQNDRTDVMVSCYSDDQDGVLYFDFSVNGTDWRTFPPSGFTVTAGVHEFHTAVKGPRYFRVRFTAGSNPTTLQILTYYGQFRQPSTPIGLSISNDADAIVTKSVISGVGDTNAKVTDHQALQVTLPPEGKSAFGEVSVVKPFPVVQLQFPYNINTDLLNVYQNTSGAVSHASRMCNITSGASANSFGRITSKKIIKYNPGQGIMTRFACRFGTGTANNIQIAGIGTESDGFFFGYNGTSFGVLHRYNGKPEIRTLQITTASTTAENITVTLDGVAIATIAVTNSGVITTTANEIAAGDYSSVGNGWTANAKGDTVEFISWDAAAHSGTFSITASTAAGTFTQRVVGVAPTEDWIAQANWNGDDIFDGNGITGVNINPTLINVFQIKFQYLGGGLISFYIEDPDDGELHLVHAIEYANSNTTPSLGDASMPLYAESNNSSNTSAVAMNLSSMAGFIEGEPERIGVRYGTRSTKTDVTTSLRPLLTVRQGTYINSLAVRTFSTLLRLAVSAEHTKPINIVLIQNGSLTGASFARISSNSSIEIDTSSSAISSGTEIDSVPIGKTGQQRVSYLDDYFANNILPGETITICAITDSGAGGEATVGVSLIERV